MNRLPDFLSLIDQPLDVARWVSALRIIQGFEAWQAHGPFIETHQPQLGPGIRERFRFAASVSHSDYRRALEERRLCGQEFEAAIDPASLLCFPTAPGPAPSLEEPEAALEAHRTVLLQLMALSSLRGSPEISLPLLTVKGLSVGVSLVAPRHTDRILLQRARELTQRALAAP
jgi:amidase